MQNLLNTIPRRVLISMGISVLLLVAAGVGLVANRIAERAVPAVFPGLDSTEFALEASTGEVVRNTDLLGRPVALFFGFTHCPEICPTTLFTLSGLIDDIGGTAKDIQIVFITVDPERDTAAILGDYISAIDDRAIGLSGSVDAIDNVLKGFGIYAAKVPLEDDYTMDHTATVFLYDRRGRLDGTIAWGEPLEFARAKLVNLISD